MLKTELKLPFVFYSVLIKQYRNRPQNLAGEPFMLLSLGTAMLPFQFRVPDTTGTVIFKSIEIYTPASNGGYDILENTITDFPELEVKHSGAYAYFTYKGDLLSEFTIPIGCHFIRINVGIEETTTDTVTSETFKVVDDVSGYVRLQWWNSNDIDPLLYQTGYKSHIYLDTYTEVVAPELQEEGQENGEGEFIPTFQRMAHKHKIELFAPDYLLDALAFMQMHDNIWLTENGEETEIVRIKVANEYADNYGGISKIEFEIPDSYINTACGTGIILVD